MQRLKLSEFWVPTTLRDRLICFKTGDKTNHCYGCASSKSAKVKQCMVITSVLDPQVLPPYAVADLYGRRWRIEEAFNTAKRLLGLSYLWTGSINGVKLKFGQLGCSTVLIDLADAVADELCAIWPYFFGNAVSWSLSFPSCIFSGRATPGFVLLHLKTTILMLWRRSGKSLNPWIYSPFPDKSCFSLTCHVSTSRRVQQ